MNDNGPKILLAITKAMVERGIEVLTRLTDEDTKAEDATDAQIVIALFTEMWKVHMAEVETIKRGKLPKSMIVKPHPLIMPTQGRH